MKLHLDSNNYVTGYTVFCLNYDKLDGVEYTGEIPSDFDQNCGNYKYVDNKLVLDDEKLSAANEKQKLKELREMRKQICFPYINRGYLWYSKLTDAQREELDIWYQAWLDVTETKVAPEMPEWLI